MSSANVRDQRSSTQRRYLSLTRQDFLALCTAGEGETLAGTPAPVVRAEALHVQVRKAGAVVCGRVLDVVDGRDGRVDFFQVATQLGTLWVAHVNVRACGGTDGRCHCEGDAGVQARACEGRTPEASVVTPLGNTGVAA